MTSPIDLGSGPTLDLDQLLTTRLLVQGSSGSGKTYLLKRLLERSAERVRQIIIDPEGEFTYLRNRSGHSVIDAERHFAYLPALGAQAREKNVSVVLDLSGLEPALQVAAVGLFLPAIFEVDKAFWHPALVVVDEAHLFASAESAGDKAARAASSSAMANLMSRGRKRGLCGILATQRLSKISKNVVAEALNFLVGRTFLDIDLARTTNLLGLPKSDAGRFRELEQGQFAAFGPALTLDSTETVRVGAVAVAATARPGDPLAPLVLPGQQAPAHTGCCGGHGAAARRELPEPLRSLLAWVRARSPATLAPTFYLDAARAVPGVVNSLGARTLVASLERQGLVTITDGAWGRSLSASQEQGR